MVFEGWEHQTSNLYNTIVKKFETFVSYQHKHVGRQNYYFLVLFNLFCSPFLFALMYSILFTGCVCVCAVVCVWGWVTEYVSVVVIIYI